MGAARADDDAVTIRCFLLVKLLGEIRLMSGRSIFFAWGKELGAARRCVSTIGWLSQLGLFRWVEWRRDVQSR